MFSDGGILTFPFWIFFCSRSLGAVNASSRFLVVGTEEGKNAGVLGAPERRVAFDNLSFRTSSSNAEFSRDVHKFVCESPSAYPEALII
jgi:hypothetical protein